jgi:hypothetical protein
VAYSDLDFVRVLAETGAAVTALAQFREVGIGFREIAVGELAVEIVALCH